MPRNKFFLLALSVGIGVSGCSRAPILVYVDTQKIKPIVFPSSSPLPEFKEPLFPEKKSTLNASAAQSITTSKEEENEKQVADLLQKQQDQLYAASSVLL